jgi:hypothetical protein
MDDLAVQLEADIRGLVIESDEYADTWFQARDFDNPHSTDDLPKAIAKKLIAAGWRRLT